MKAVSIRFTKDRFGLMADAEFLRLRDFFRLHKEQQGKTAQTETLYDDAEFSVILETCFPYYEREDEVGGSNIVRVLDKKRDVIIDAFYIDIEHVMHGGQKQVVRFDGEDVLEILLAVNRKKASLWDKLKAVFQ